MLKFELREQRAENIVDLIEHLQEESAEVEESFENTHKGLDDLLDEVMDVIQLCLAIISYYEGKEVDLANERHLKKLRTTHKNRYNLGEIQEIAYLHLEKEE